MLAVLQRSVLGHIGGPPAANASGPSDNNVRWLAEGPPAANINL